MYRFSRDMVAFTGRLRLAKCARASRKLVPAATHMHNESPMRKYCSRHVAHARYGSRLVNLSTLGRVQPSYTFGSMPSAQVPSCCAAAAAATGIVAAAFAARGIDSTKSITNACQLSIYCGCRAMRAIEPRCNPTTCSSAPARWCISCCYNICACLRKNAG